MTMDVPKVLDFGLARALAPPSASASSADGLTQPGMLVGTPQYMPPEQLRGEHATAAWDLWALALIAYEMLTGALPFAGRLGGAVTAGQDAAIAAALNGPLAGTRDTFARALALDPSVRYLSAAALVEALEHALRQEREDEPRMGPSAGSGLGLGLGGSAPASASAPLPAPRSAIEPSEP